MSQELESLSPVPVPVSNRGSDLPQATEGSSERWLGLDHETDSLADQSAVAAVPEPREITFEGTLRINGYVAGIIRSSNGNLIVDAGGEVDANISVHHATIYGCVRGDIHAKEKVELRGSARVIGDIETVTLSIEPGAVFEGRCIFVQSAPES